MFINSTVNKHLGCFQFGTIINKLLHIMQRILYTSSSEYINLFFLNIFMQPILCVCLVAYITYIHQIRSVAQSCPTLCDPINHSTPGLPVHHQLPEFTQTHAIESVKPSSHLILCHPLLLLPSIFPSIRVFSNESVHISWPKYWSFKFSISPSNEYSGLISFRMD